VAWRAAGLVIAIAGASILAWSVWRGSRPVGGLQRGEAEWLVPAAPEAQPTGSSAASGHDAGHDAGAALTPEATSHRGPGAPAAPASSTAPPVPLLIDINIASAAQLELLPAIGPTLAARIVADREANGPFATVDDLGRVRGIGEKTLAGVRAFVVCGGG
jgi:competence ComEA-like helix-hairpin-helix protein